MARLPPRGAHDPITDKYERALVERVASTFWLPGERVLHAGLGQHEATAERFGRGEGEGVLYLTTHRVIFWFDSPHRRRTEFVAIPKEALDSVKSERIVTPGMRAVSLFMTDGGRARFYVGRPLAGIIERDWRVSEPLGDSAPSASYAKQVETVSEDETNLRSGPSDPATLTGGLVNEPSIHVLARLEGAEVVVTSRDGLMEERFIVNGMIGPSDRPEREETLSFLVDSPYWGFLFFEPPVPDRWVALAEDLKERRRVENAISGSMRSHDPVVADSSPEAQRVWYVLPPPLDEVDVGVSIDNISVQTGLTSADLMRALAELEAAGLLERNAQDSFRRVEGWGGS